MPRASKKQGTEALKRPPKQHFKLYRDNAPLAFAKMERLFAQDDAMRTTEVKDYTLLANRKTVMCNPCGKPFYDKSTYDRHFRHAIEHSSIRVACPDCDKTFGQKDSFLAHYCIYHSHEYPFNCSDCCAKFQAPYQKSEHWCGDKHTKRATQAIAAPPLTRVPLPAPIETHNLVVCSASSSGSATPSLAYTPSASSYSLFPATPSLAFTPSTSSSNLLPSPLPASIRYELHAEESSFDDANDELPPWTRPTPSSWHDLDNLVHPAMVIYPNVLSRARTHPPLHTLDLVPMSLSGDGERAQLPSLNQLFPEIINKCLGTCVGPFVTQRTKEDIAQLARFQVF